MEIRMSKLRKSFLAQENGRKLGVILRSYLLYQYHHCHVTQPKLLKQMSEWGIDISSGQLNRILVEDKDKYHAEKQDILRVGLSVSSYINTDDTSARHQGVRQL